MIYCVMFSRPDGSEAYLGKDHCGPAESEAKAWSGTREEAEESAAERNRVHGPAGFRYWVKPAADQSAALDQAARQPLAFPQPPPVECKHESFDCECAVNRLEDCGRFMLDVRVRCLQCGAPFVFLGLPLGLDLNSASASPDGTEARMGISPKGEPVPPVHGVEGYTIRKTMT